MEVGRDFLEDVRVTVTEYRNCGLAGSMHQYCDSILETIDHLLGEWIDINVEQPPKDEVVEVMTREGNILSAYLCPHCGKEWRCGLSGLGLMIDVTHWRPLRSER